MRILLYGAANIGCLYAAKFAHSGPWIREGLEVLRANDIPIIPSNHRVLLWLPETLVVFETSRPSLIPSIKSAKPFCCCSPLH